MERPGELAACLAAILAGRALPREVVVSDDSRTPEAAEATRLACEQSADPARVRYVAGPRRGQGPNRQHGAQASRGAFVGFIDDDARMSEDFLEVMWEAGRNSDGRTIFTGDLIEKGRRWQPTNLTFWGHFGRPFRPGVDVLETVVFNTNLFPREVFERVSFDRHLRYGYEDSDFCAEALATGFRIEYIAAACNTHLPSDANRPEGEKLRERARYYTNLKRLWLVQRRPLAGLVFLCLGPVRQAASDFRRGSPGKVLRVLPDVIIALGHLADEVVSRRKRREL